MSNAPSPFLPGTKIQYAWDSTSLGYFKTCPRLYQYIMLEGYQAPGESIHLRFGIEYHLALQDYELALAAGAEKEDAIKEVVQKLLIRTKDWDPDTDVKAGKYKNRESIVQLVIDYLDMFADDPAETYILETGQPAVELSFRFELDWGPGVNGGAMQYIKDPTDPTAIREFVQPYILCGHLDRVVSFTGDLFAMDRKTTYQTISPHWFDQWSPSNQMTLYTLASKIILDAPIKGVIIDAAQLLLTEPNRFVRGFTLRTEDQLSEWMQDLRSTLINAERYATEGYWPMNDTSCDKFGGCRFREVCSKSPQVREKFLKSGYAKLPEGERWNPLKPR